MSGTKELLESKYQEMVEALQADLETGTHNGNNAASSAFAAKHPRLIKAMGELHRNIEAMEG